MPIESHEGFVKVLGYDLYWRDFGTARKGTVLCLHGGPGVTHDYLLPLADLAGHGYRVVFYDQLGCGRSEMPKDIRLYVPERYVEEIEGFRRVMELDRVHVVGSSWGGALALAYAIRRQRAMRSLITIGGLHSIPLVDSEMRKLRKTLPAKIQETLAKCESAGDYESPEYVNASMIFNRRYACRMKVWPKELEYSMDHMNKTMHNIMSGPCSFETTGNTRYWDITSELHRISVPTLIVTGKYDMVSPRVGSYMKRHIAGSELVVLSRSSHNPFWEQRSTFMRIISRFLSRHWGLS